MTSKEFKIEGMSCMHCVKSVKIEFENLPLENSEIKIGSAKVKYDESKVSENEVVAAIEEAGFKVVQ